jgi:hypothetical protein
VAASTIATASQGGFKVTPVGVRDGALVVRADVDVLGRPVGVTARLRAEGGAIRVVPDVPLLGALLQPTVFSDPRISVDSVRARADGSDYVVTATAHLT